MEIEKPLRRRRNHSEEFKQAVIAACGEPGASVAGIALANGVNANQVRRCMRERGVEPPRRRQPVPAMGDRDYLVKCDKNQWSSWRNCALCLYMVMPSGG